MAQDSRNLTTRAGVASRKVAATLIAGVWRTRSARDVDMWLRRRPMQRQRLMTGGVLAAVLGLSIVAAQFGWVGMLLFWLAVILVVN